MTQKILVIGSNSFSGASFVAYALARGAQVVGTSRSEQPTQALLPYRWGPHSEFSFRRIDLNHDLDALMRVVEDFRPQWVVNFAAQSMVAPRPPLWVGLLRMRGGALCLSRVPARCTARGAGHV